MCPIIIQLGPTQQQEKTLADIITQLEKVQVSKSTRQVIIRVKITVSVPDEKGSEKEKVKVELDEKGCYSGSDVGSEDVSMVKEESEKETEEEAVENEFISVRAKRIEA
ncbi:hypothetical protein IAT38_000171 [Cryptococcus sp. DSM 104549]